MHECVYDGLRSWLNQEMEVKGADETLRTPADLNHVSHLANVLHRWHITGHPGLVSRCCKPDILRFLTPFAHSSSHTADQLCSQSLRFLQDLFVQIILHEVVSVLSMQRVLCMRTATFMASAGATKAEHGVATALKDVRQRISAVRERTGIAREVQNHAPPLEQLPSGVMGALYAPCIDLCHQCLLQDYRAVIHASCHICSERPELVREMSPHGSC